MVDKSDIDAQIATSIKNFSMLAKDESSRHKNVMELPDFITQKAALISAHFLLPSGATVIDMACGQGEVTYAFAALNPLIQVIGLDQDRRSIEFARKTYNLPNLSFRTGDIRVPDFEDNSIDGIINSNILYQIYSENDRDPIEVTAVLQDQIKKLKPGGSMLIRDYMMPPEDEYVLIELPDIESAGPRVTDLSDADLLVRYSQTARPLAQGYEGFFLEELDPKREGTRLFRLQHKWALEFIHRKDSRQKWIKEEHQEFTFFTYRDYRREFSHMGMRMVYSAPYWNPWVVKNCFDGRFQLYQEDGTPKAPPATNYFIIAQKVGSEKSLILEERRPSQRKAEKLNIVTVRDTKTGQRHELVKRPGESCDIIPYRFTRDGRLMVYVRSGQARPIVNAVSRGIANLDGKRWSGHLIEPITMDTMAMSEEVEENKQQIFDFVEHTVKLKFRNNATLHVGPTLYPAPDQIDEAIEPVFLEVHKPPKSSWEFEYGVDDGFTKTGVVMELDAAEIIRASQVGLLPEPRLEIHIFDLMMRYDIEPPAWIGEKMPGEELFQMDQTAVAEAEELLDNIELGPYEKERVGHTRLSPVRSVFVEEGKFGGAVRGLNSQDVEFIVTEDGIENIAIVLPLTKGWDNTTLVALEPKMLPVPQRVGGSGGILTAPSFVLPKDVHTIQDAKKFVADKFGISPDRVGRLGESYFTHTEVTPQRVYPFVIAAEGEAYPATWHYTAMRRLWILLYCYECFSADLLKCIARTHMLLGAEHGLCPVQGHEKEMARNPKFELTTDKLELGQAQYKDHRPKSRILGERGSVDMVAPSAKASVDLTKIDDIQKPELEMPDPEHLKKILEGEVEQGCNEGASCHSASQHSSAFETAKLNILDGGGKELKTMDRHVEEIGEELRRQNLERSGLDKPRPS